MPKCKVCGKDLQNPTSTRHINSKYHQKKLKELKTKEGQVSKSKFSTGILIDKKEILELRNLVGNLAKRVLKIENRLNLSQLSTESVISVSRPEQFRDEQELEQEIIKIINQRSGFQDIKGIFALKDLKDIVITEYNFSENEFEECLLKLYRKQIVDLQPGGNPTDYHLLSPTGKKFYYLKMKN